MGGVLPALAYRKILTLAIIYLGLILCHTLYHEFVI